MSAPTFDCPTCGHRMDGANETVFDWATIFYCPRCGTLRKRDGSFRVPLLVARCREYEEKVWTGSPGNYWNILGIAESINKAEPKEPT